MHKFRFLLTAWFGTAMPPPGPSAGTGDMS